MKFTITAITAALASTVSAMDLSSLSQRADEAEDGSVYAKVTAINHNLSGNTTPDKELEIPFGTLFHVDDTPITELQLKGAGATVPDLPEVNVSKITCQRYNDQYGTRVGSATFTAESPALISTNAVEFGWVLCYIHA
ncbi:hypothetical protein LEL_04629 [Akanthomyces lecanii RCEF 1005]|uniref:Uncharacterized protein n=1 Tax=Akanthomyces lecanii RCEF 1005 TaxID=1081108 RepID=A0A168HI51_CORDF|nr:hypothetical protein LEL_04629 [Akanthomyces lecanii RCEF 1005]